VPAGVWVLGVVSLLTDVSSEIVNSLLPLYLVGVTGASVAAVGLLEGVAVFIATVAKTVSGMASDRWRRRKPLIVAGYALAAFSRLLIPLTATLAGIVTAKCLDRVGKGVRSTARDALVADLAPPDLRGASFGLRKSLDTVGGFLGPLAAMFLLVATAGDYLVVFWWATVPAFVAVALLVVGVRESPRSEPVGTAFRWSAAVRLTPSTRRALLLAAVVGLTRISEAFVLLRAVEVGLPVAQSPLLLVLLHAVSGVVSYPVGVLSDSLGRRAPLFASLAALVVAHGLLALATSPTWVAGGVMMWGLHLGLAQGSQTALVVDATPHALVGSALGWLSLVTGVVLLVGNAAAGFVWAAYGPQWMFGAAAVLTLLAAGLATGAHLRP